MAIETVSEPGLSVDSPRLTRRQVWANLKDELEDLRSLLEALEQVNGGKASCHGRLAGIAMEKLISAESYVAELEQAAQ